MKKLLYIYILIFFSCDPGWLGLEEESGIYSYHDGLALAWETFFSSDDHDISIAYANSAINDTEDVDYYNSAYTALGWFYMFKSNTFAGNNSDSLDYYRKIARDKFLYNIQDQKLAVEDYSSGCYYDFCCSDCFVADRELGFLYSHIEAYFISSEDDKENIDIDNFLNLLIAFVNDNADYDFMNGKPTGNNGEILDLKLDDIIVYLSHVHFRLGQFTESCNWLNSLSDYKDCNLDCSIDWDNTNLDILLDCMNNETLF